MRCRSFRSCDTAESHRTDPPGCETDDAQAAAWYRKAADQGDTEAQTRLAEAYAKGIGVPKDPVQAVLWYQKVAAKAFQNDAMYALGMAYYKGEGVANSDSLAESWFRKAANNGHAQSMNNLGVLYNQGRGVKQNLAEAARWYTKAAEKGNPTAQSNLASAYANGSGVAKDEVLASACRSTWSRPTSGSAWASPRHPAKLRPPTARP